jgi:hypothetical protein
MSIQLELWHLILLLLAFFGLVGAFGKILLDQIEKRLNERFASQEKQRAEDQKHWDSKFAALEAAAREESSQWARVERELLALKADLPREYVRREDYIRNQTILEMKIDKVFGKLELLQIQGGRND